jgi:sugar phosphate isomerase/epimerase
MRTGISTLVDLNVPLPRLLEMVAASGFDCVSLSHKVEHAGYHTPGGLAELKRLLELFGLQLNYIHPPIQPYLDISSLQPQVRRMGIETLKMSIDACSALGGRAVTVHVSNEADIPADEHEGRIAAGLESLAELVPYSVERSVLFCIENLPGNLDANTITLELLRRCELPDLWVTLDPNHAWIGSADPLGLIAELAPRVRATHFSDTFGRDDSHLLPGRGKVDFLSVARLLAAAGFSTGRGDVVDLECSIMMQRHRVERNQLHEGDPGYHAPDPAHLTSAIRPEQVYGISLPSTEEYLMLAHAAASRIAAQIESPAKAA